MSNTMMTGLIFMIGVSTWYVGEKLGQLLAELQSLRKQIELTFTPAPFEDGHSGWPKRTADCLESIQHLLERIDRRGAHQSGLDE